MIWELSGSVPKFQANIKNLLNATQVFRLFLFLMLWLHGFLMCFILSKLSFDFFVLKDRMKCSINECVTKYIDQAFIGAVLLMAVFELRSSFQMFYFLKNDHKIIVKCRWRSLDAVSSTMGLWRSPGASSEGKVPEKCWSFYIWRTNK